MNVLVCGGCSLYKSVDWLTASIGDRKYGWAPLGHTPVQTLPLKRSKRWSILPALTIDGYLDWIIYHGSINTASYIDFVRTKVFPHCFPFASGRERSVLIMDNARIHHNKELLRLCEEAGVLVEYLPPYSPDFNPVEITFSILKAWIKRHLELAAAHAESQSFGDFLQLAVESQEGAYNTRNLFRKARILYPGDESIDDDVEESDEPESD